MSWSFFFLYFIIESIPDISKRIEGKVSWRGKKLDAKTEMWRGGDREKKSVDNRLLNHFIVALFIIRALPIHEVNSFKVHSYYTSKTVASRIDSKVSILLFSHVLPYYL